MRQVLQSAMIITNCDSTSLLQSAMDSCYKLRQLILWHVTDELEKICQRHWKEGLNISKLANLESDTSKACKDN